MVGMGEMEVMEGKADQDPGEGQEEGVVEVGMVEMEVSRHTIL